MLRDVLAAILAIADVIGRVVSVLYVPAMF